jgi:hypothetical protein
MVKPFPSKTHIGNHTLHPETLMLNYGYDPQLSEGAVATVRRVGRASKRRARPREAAQSIH